MIITGTYDVIIQQTFNHQIYQVSRFNPELDVKSNLLKGRHAVLIIIGIESTWVGYWNGKKVIHLSKLKLDTSINFDE